VVTRIPPMPQDNYGAAWAELTGYVQQAADDGGVIDPAGLLTYLGELRRTALAPVREWMDLIRSTPEDDLPTLAQIAYEAYGDMTGGVNYQGLPMPGWADLPARIKAAWNAAVNATVKTVLEEWPLSAEDEAGIEAVKRAGREAWDLHHRQQRGEGRDG
jgi:hypothetical protein